MLGRRLVSSFFVHRGLANKDRLFEQMGRSRIAASGAPTLEYIVCSPELAVARDPDTAGAELDDFLRELGVGDGCAMAVDSARLASPEDEASVIESIRTWLCGDALVGARAVVVKNARANNALAVRFCGATAKDIMLTLKDLTSEIAAEGERGVVADGSVWLLQRCFDQPLLLGPAPASLAASAPPGEPVRSDAGTRPRCGGCGEPASAADFDGLCCAPAKFTLRVNVLARGRAAVSMYDDPLVHCAAEGWCPCDWGRRYRHISNHSLHKDHPRYSADRHTLRLSVACRRIEAGDLGLWRHVATADTQVGAPATRAGEASSEAPVRAQWGRDIFEHVPVSALLRREGAAAARAGDGGGLARALLRRLGGSVCALFARAACADVRSEWLPQPGCFEVFGLDVLPEYLPGSGDRSLAAVRLRLLECNAGPALGGLADPALCESTVEAVWRVAVDPWLAACSQRDDSGEAAASAAATSSAADSSPPAFMECENGTPFRCVLQLAPTGSTGPQLLAAGFLEHAKAVLAADAAETGV